MPIYAVILIVALLGGGVSAAAQTTVPGDTLYPVKVRFNEEVRAALTVDADARAAYDVRLIARRLEEAETLAARGDLTTDVAMRIRENFEEHAERADSRIDDFEAKDDFAAAVDVAVKFQTSLEAHEQILVKLAEETDRRDDVAVITDAVRLRIRNVTDGRIRLEGRVFDQKTDERNSEERDERIVAYAESLRTEALAQIRLTAEFIQEHQARIPDGEAERAKAQLRIAENLVEEGTVALNAENYREAVRIFRNAWEIAWEVMVVLNAKTDLSLEAKVDLDVEFNEEARPVDVMDDVELRERSDALFNVDLEMDRGSNSDSGSGNSDSGSMVEPVSSDSLNADARKSLKERVGVEL